MGSYNDAFKATSLPNLLNWRDLSQLALFWHTRDLLVPYQWRHANE